MAFPLLNRLILKHQLCRTASLHCHKHGISARSCSSARPMSENVKHINKSPLFKVIDNASVDTASPEYIENKEHLQTILASYREALGKAQAPSHEKALKRHKAQNKLFIEERLCNLLDNRNDFFELSPLSGLNMEYGDVPRAGAILGIGKVNGRYCVVFINDGTIKGGTVYPITLKKQLRGQEIAEQNRLPCIYIVDSGGAFLPLQSEIFPDKSHGGRVFYNLAIMSALGIPQVAVVVGNCTAGGAYLPMMCDEAIIVHQIGRIFLGGPPLVLAATGEVVSAEDLGGATMHSSVSGCTDYFSESEEAAYVTCRDVVSTLPHHPSSLHSSQTNTNTFDEPSFSPQELEGLIPAVNQHEMDVYKVIARIVDGSRFHEFKKLFGTTLVSGFAHIHGRLVGVIGNNGELTEHAADKGAHFVKVCSEREVPIVFLQNISPSDCHTSYTDGDSAGAKIKSQSRMLAEVSCSPVPKVTVVIGNSYGVPAYAMGGRCVGANFTFLWPNARVAIMDPSSLSQSIQQEAGEGLSEEKQNKLDARTNQETSAIYSSCHIWDDGVIEPCDTRQVIGRCLEIFEHKIPVTSSPNAPVIRM